MRSTTYFKRYRMEVDLCRPPFGIAGPAGVGLRAAQLPPGLCWLAWHDSLLDAHAEVKAACFEGTMDTIVFPCLGSRSGCRDLMGAIRYRPGFCPQATWLVAVEPGRDGPAGDGGVATIQGIIDEAGHGGIQNVGVLPEYRGRGIGRALVLRALAGFAAIGVRRAFLEVTARNEAAVRMYRDLGFRSSKTLYREVKTPEPVAVSI